MTSSSPGKANQRPQRADAAEYASAHGAAHVDPADAYRGVPFLKQPLWKNEIAAYFFLGGVSAATSLLGSIAALTGGEEHRRLARTAHYISFVAFLPCPLLLIDDLGVPTKFYHMLRIFKPSSPMNLGSWAFALHGAGATAMLLRMLAAERKLLVLTAPLKIVPERLLAALGIPGSLVLAGYTGVLLGTTSIPVWSTSRLLGALFTASSFSTGAAALALASSSRSDPDMSQVSIERIRIAADAATLLAFLSYVRSSGDAGRALWSSEHRLLNMGSMATLVAALAGLRRPKHGQSLRVTKLVSATLALVSGVLMRWGIVRVGSTSASDRQGALRSMSASAKRPGWTPPPVSPGN